MKIEKLKMDLLVTWSFTSKGMERVEDKETGCVIRRGGVREKRVWRERVEFKVE